MKVLFIGLGKNGESSLKALLQKKYAIDRVIVSSSHDNSGIQRLCNKKKIKIIGVSGKEELERKILSESTDLVIVASFPYLFSKKVIAHPKYGIINVHASLLPSYRGYHPIHWAIINNENRTGVSIHYVESGIDSGDILIQKEIPIKITDDINTLVDKTSFLGAKMLVEILPKVIKSKGKLKGVRQKPQYATKAPKRSPKDGKINWGNDTRSIFNLIRALKSPYPNAFSYSENKKVEISDVYVPKIAGEVVGEMLGYKVITTGDGVILVKTKTKLRKKEVLK